MPWSDVVLCTDNDLKGWEARMPELARSYAGQATSNAYDGKRDLAKRRIEKRLRTDGVDPERIANPDELTDAATFLELALIFRDLAYGDDTYTAAKAGHYDAMYEAEWASLSLTLIGGDEPAHVPTSIPLRRM